MTSKTSFFNKGIYLSGLKRFSRGSILYFIILFIFTSLNCMLSVAPYSSGFYRDGLILSNEYVIIPAFLGVVVPVIVAMLLFSFLHSKNYSVFIHSLPVSKTANFVSTVAAGLTLMILPIIANTVALMILSLAGYGSYFTVTDCIVWMAINIFIVFTIFSCAVFSSVITGNVFAVVVINILIHSFLFIILTSLQLMALKYLFGFSDSWAIFETIFNYNFVCVAFSLSNMYFVEDIFPWGITILTLSAVIIYVLSFFLYKKRRIETASDVAGFDCLNVIFKYLVTFLATIFVFAVFSSGIYRSSVVFYVMLVIISAVTYFGVEMILKKTVHTFYAYKGYLAFAVVFAAIILVFYNTTFFGYETRVPELSEIEAATLYERYYTDGAPYSDNPEVIKEITDIHSSLIKVRTKEFEGYGNSVEIKYILKNGNEIKRKYYISANEISKIMNGLYEYTDYKMLCEPVFRDNAQMYEIYYDDEPVENKEELLEALRLDIKNLDYYDIIREGNHHVRMELVIEDSSNSYHYDNVYININEKFKNTAKWVTENIKLP